MALLLGLDFGTGGVRVGVFDLERRTMLAEREARYPTRYPHPGLGGTVPARLVGGARARRRAG